MTAYTDNGLKQAMADYFERFVADFKRHHRTLPWACIQEDVDPRFYRGHAGEGWAYWLPVEKTVHTDLTELEQAYGSPLHPDISTYFNSFWFARLGGRIGDHTLELEAVLPGTEAHDFAFNLRRYCEHNQTRRWVPLGIETSISQLIVIDTENGTVCVHDCDFQEIIPIAANLTELIRGWI